jgi:hypothetical protein
VLYVKEGTLEPFVRELVSRQAVTIENEGRMSSGKSHPDVPPPSYIDENRGSRSSSRDPGNQTEHTNLAEKACKQERGRVGQTTPTESKKRGKGAVEK